MSQESGVVNSQQVKNKNAVWQTLNRSREKRCGKLSAGHAEKTQTLWGKHPAGHPEKIQNTVWQRPSRSRRENAAARGSIIAVANGLAYVAQAFRRAHTGKVLWQCSSVLESHGQKCAWMLTCILIPLCVHTHLSEIRGVRE